MRNLSPEEFRQFLNEGAVLLDVRMPEELELAALPRALNIPLPDLPDRIDELNPAASIAVLCHHGVRSEMAGRFLEQRGFSQIAHLVGGIDAWSAQLDACVPRY